MTGRMLAGIEEVILAERPDIVLVPGDTNSTLAGALGGGQAACAGGASRGGAALVQPRMPEEINRVLTDHLSALLLCPTETAIANLRREGIVAGVHRHRRRDVRCDTVRGGAGARVDRARAAWLATSALCGRHRAPRRKHRRSANSLAAILDFLKQRARDRTGRAAASPAHPHSRSRAGSSDLGPLVVCEPLGYLDMHRLLQSAVGGLYRFGRVAEGGLFPPRSLRHLAQRNRMGGDHRGRAGTGCGRGRIMRRAATSRLMATGMPPRKRST